MDSLGKSQGWVVLEQSLGTMKVVGICLTREEANTHLTLNRTIQGPVPIWSSKLSITTDEITFTFDKPHHRHVPRNPFTMTPKVTFDAFDPPRPETNDYPTKHFWGDSAQRLDSFH